METLVVTEKAAGQLIGVGPRTVRRLLGEGDLVALRIRKRTYVLRSSIEDLVRRRCGEAKIAPESSAPTATRGAS